MEDLSQFVPKVHFEQIPIRNLVSNQDYQRNLSQKHIERAVENFDLYQIKPVKVSRRDGINFVFDGQHTIEIVALKSGSRDTPVWCMVYDDLSYEHEADIFAHQQKHVKPLLPYEMFMANIEAGNNDQLVIQGLVESYGLTLSTKNGPGNIVAISTIEKIYQRYGYHVLSRTLLLIISAWEGDHLSLSSNVLNAVSKIVVVYGETLNDNVFKEKLGAVSIRALLRKAKDRRGGAMGVAEAIILEYNGKKKAGSLHRLRMNRLYEKESSFNFGELSPQDEFDDPEDYDDDNDFEDDDIDFFVS